MTTDETPTIKVTPEMLAAAHAQAGEDRAPTQPATATPASVRVEDDEDTVKTASISAVNAPAPSATRDAAPDAAADVASEVDGVSGADVASATDVADIADAEPAESSPASFVEDEAATPAEDADLAPRLDPTDLSESSGPDASDAVGADEFITVPSDDSTAEESAAPELAPDLFTDDPSSGDEPITELTDALDEEALAQPAEAQTDASAEALAQEAAATDETGAVAAPIVADVAIDEIVADVSSSDEASTDMTATDEAVPDATPDELTDEAAAASVASAPDEATEVTPATSLDLEARDPEFARYYAVRNHFGNLAFSPDSSQLAIIVNTSGQFNVWRQNVTGGWATQVTTFEDESARAILWAPSGELYGIADRAGNEQYDIFTIPATGGVTTYLTDRPDAQYQISEDSLSPDGRLLAYSGNDRVPTDGDVLVRDLQSGEVRRLLTNGRFNLVVNWSPDGRYLTAVDLRSNTDLHTWLIEVATGEAREILAHDDQFLLVPGPWLPDSSGFYVVTDRGREFKGVARYRLETDEMEWVVAPEWDVEQLALSDDGRRLIWALNESGRSQLYLRDNDQAPLRVVGLPVGVFESLTLSPDGQTLALRINAATAPAEVYIVTLGPIGALATPHLRRLTYGMLGGLEPSALAEPELVTFPTFDGRQIPAWLYRPRNLAPGQTAPLVVSIHGGPEAQERVEYKPFYQYLLAKGIGVLAPNIRGSTGYGLAYQKLIHRDWGGAELKDIRATAEYARTLSWVNPDRLGVYGGSFGGFATLSAVTRLPDYWAAAVDIVGPSNLLTFVRSVPPTWLRLMAAWVGDPDVEADVALLRERSPITYVENVRAPLLVLQGANDPRVAKAESDQMVERLRGMGREVEYVVFEDEGHGFTKRVNIQRAYRLAANFFLRQLQG